MAGLLAAGVYEHELRMGASSHSAVSVLQVQQKLKLTSVETILLASVSMHSFPCDSGYFLSAAHIGL